MAETKDEMTSLLEQLYDDAVNKGRRDEPLIIKLGQEVEKRKPKEKPEAKPA
jgi:hypothetical protein